MIYLDNAATSGHKPDVVVQAVTEAMKVSVNAGRGSYAMARQAVQIMDTCRQNLLELGKIKAGYHVFFSPSATIALNQIILGLPIDSYTTIYASPFEHNAVMRPLYATTQRNGGRLEMLPFSQDTWGFDADIAEAQFLSHKPDYIFVSLVSNTTGYILPVKEIISLAHGYGARVIADCAQAFGAVDVDLADIGADAYVFAGHKTLYGPYGIAGMILKDDWRISTGIFGGTGSDSLNLDMPNSHAGGYEPGSANLPAICGLNAAATWIRSIGIDHIQEYERKLIQMFINKVSHSERITLYKPPMNAISGIIAFNVEGYQSHEVGSILDDDFDIAVRTGYQCAPWVHDWLHTKAYTGIVRMSVSNFNTEAEIETMVRSLETL